MKLSNDDRKTIVKLQIEKAHRFLKQAGMVRDMQQWDLSANRYYYACFHAVQALFVHNGLSSKTHSGMLSQFGLHFIKTGIVEDRLGAFLTRMEQLREKGDYNCLFSISEEDLLTIIEPAHELISVIEELINE
ncbi:MAG: HEPN domain-containing protein [Prevotella sp.]|nr:HEPN domain-containing protein [Prevotella sp.]